MLAERGVEECGRGEEGRGERRDWMMLRGEEGS